MKTVTLAPDARKVCAKGHQHPTVWAATVCNTARKGWTVVRGDSFLCGRFHAERAEADACAASHGGVVIRAMAVGKRERIYWQEEDLDAALIALGWLSPQPDACVPAAVPA